MADLVLDHRQLPHAILLKPNGDYVKSMTCEQLGGACDEVFSAETFDDISAQSQRHGREMIGAKDAPHLAAMARILQIMNSGEFDAWMAARKAEFDSLG